MFMYSGIRKEMKNSMLYVVLIVLTLTITGCAAPPKKPMEPVFYPSPPELPRIQYLTSYTGSQDIEEGKSVFELFVTGGQEMFKRLDKPYGVAINNGKIYVCDTNDTLMVFDFEKGTFGKLLGAQGLGKLIQPINITTDKRDGTKYVTDPVRGQVVIFDKNDFYVGAFGIAGEWKPVDVAVYEDRLYVADPKNKEIRVVDKKTGDLIKKIGQKKEDPEGILAIPTNVAFDKEGYLYVSDAGRFQIVKFDRDGHFRGTIGKLGANPSTFARPRGIAIDRDDRVYAVDAAFDNVQVFNKEGRLLMFFGKAGKKPGDLFLPAKVAVDYENIKYFQKYVDPRFEAEALILVTSQFGDMMVNVYALGKEKGKKYPTDEELKEEVLQKMKKFKEEAPSEKAEEYEQGK